MSKLLIFIGLLAILIPSQSIGGDNFLSAQSAFSPAISSSDEGDAILSFDIAEGYFLYADSLIIKDSDDSLLSLKLPEAQLLYDEFFDEFKPVLSGAIVADLPPTTSPYILVTYQGCALEGLCYTPTTVKLLL
ncbi:protein-disulfide reductase DsbD domain-containing protein [uncultured Umboniibacter sp.]|uniref:protein-disulfide reductase DsbD domain-containing protein n=1 Tax=uncultured Umboniibacter sp. TaxID=1798917 RepID=UPI002604241E|nr:protein-disulfide reductase DsbD domain-containing protein [uncultured Umboniibacter sp.]